MKSERHKHEITYAHRCNKRPDVIIRYENIKVREDNETQKRLWPSKVVWLGGVTRSTSINMSQSYQRKKSLSPIVEINGQKQGASEQYALLRKKRMVSLESSKHSLGLPAF